MPVGEFQPQPNLVALYHLNGNSQDFSGNNNNGTDTSITYAASGAKFIQSATFNGTSSVIDLPNVSTFKITSSFTVMGWIKKSSNPAAQQGFWATSYSRNTNNAGVFLNVETNGSIRILSGRNTGSTLGIDYQVCSGIKSICDNNWHHFAAVWDGSFLKIYVDGYLENSVAWTYSPGYATTSYSKIGCISDTGTNLIFCSCSLDELALFSVAKTQNQIKNYYAWSVGRFAKVL